MERLTDCAQGYCEMYCKKYGHCFEDPENCVFKDEIKLYDALKSIEGIVPLDRLLELADADKDGRLVVLDEKIALSMCAGARAIENNKRLFGVTYGYDIFGVCGGPKEISYYDAAKKLREIAEPVLDREEAEAALAGKGGDD